MAAYVNPEILNTFPHLEGVFLSGDDAQLNFSDFHLVIISAFLSFPVKDRINEMRAILCKKSRRATISACLYP
ncbi:hypothetical protein [Morganella morganii]|uniref:hypothetical protein n=1 Tax=Morganella morganii TaxID=582 RepID=UPI001A33850D|nr:hypothetical protein [Morganella morganii]HAT1528372.1 hypothetical protein [Morganella morganii]